MTDIVAHRVDFDVEAVEAGGSASTVLNALTSPRYQKPTNGSKSTMTISVWSKRQRERISGNRYGEICPIASALLDPEVKHYPYNSC